MRGGALLRADIYLPNRRGPDDKGHPVPALLLRTPYDRKDRDRVALARALSQTGYAVVVQDCRGRFGSDGKFSFALTEAEDGYDTVEWIAQQAWCDGQVGTFGYSYSGSLQSALATLNPPHLRAMWVHEGWSDAHSESVRQGGAFELRWMAWMLYAAATDSNLPDTVRERLTQFDVREILRTGRVPKRGQGPLALAPTHDQRFWELFTAGIHSAVWERRELNIRRYWVEHADVPTLYSGGWYDSYTRATIRNFLGLSALKRNPQYLWMGPWTHGWREVETDTAPISFGGEAYTPLLPLLRQWFDYWLKGQGSLPWTAPVRYFLMGGAGGDVDSDGRLRHGGRFLEATTWPPPESQPKRWHLSSDGMLLDRPSLRPPGTATFRFDPTNPVPTVGGNLSSLSYIDPMPGIANPPPTFDRLRPVVPAGPHDQTTSPDIFHARPPFGPLYVRPDVLVFTTPPLTRPLILAGPLMVVLYVASSALDTDWTAKIIDWYPPTPVHPWGYALNLTDGIQRLRFRQGYDHEQPYQPHTVTKVEIDLYPVANLFQPGHRLRLDVSSSNFPRFDINPNTGLPLGSLLGMVAARNSVMMTDEHPSHVVGWGFEPD
nr:CocE/NonD family hydrolase [Sulfobacillus harzensis]